MLDSFAIGQGKEDRKSFLYLHDGKALMALPHDIGDELEITLVAKIIRKEQSENNSVGSSRTVEFEITNVNIETPLKTRLKGEVF